MSKTILIAAEREADRRLLKDILCESYLIVEAEEGKTALDIIINWNQELSTLSALLLDAALPGLDGYEVLRRVRNSAVCPNIPIIMLAESVDAEMNTMSLAPEADDCIVKPCNPDIVRHCLRTNIARYEAVENPSAKRWDYLLNPVRGNRDLAVVMDNMPCGAGIYEFIDGRISLTYQNKIYWELVGLNEEAYPDDYEMSAIHPDDIPAVMQELSSAIEQGRNVECDIRLKHLTRGYRPVHLSGNVVFKKTGGFLIYATFVPIPELVIEARRQQSRLKLLTNSIPGGIAVYEGDPNNLKTITLTYFSDGFCKIFGYTREEYSELAKGNPFGHVRKEDMPNLYRNVVALVRDGVPLDYIYRVNTKSGKTQWINAKAVLGEPNEGKLSVNAVFLTMDSGEAEKLAEARAHSAKLALELDAAKSADLAKTQFLSFMSHEIRTPLNAIIGYNAIAKDEMSKAKNTEEIKQANMKVMDCLTKNEVASRHLLTIINNVLDMSAIENGKLKVEAAPFDLKNLITSLTVLFFSQAKTKGVVFDAKFVKPTEEWFIGDQLRINQVLTNLLGNAVKFTPEGGSVELKIIENIIDDRLTGFRFVVSDTGIGMTKEYMKNIWKPFEQAEATISRRFGGSGLGLSISKNLIDLMGGKIEVESEVDVGSRFTVDIVLERMTQPAGRYTMDYSEVNALIVDDDSSTCDYIKYLFYKCKAKCTTFTSGQEAIDAFRRAQYSENPFNICLVDWHMPQMDGLKVVSEIRTTSKEAMPIVVVTAYDFTELSDHAKELGVSHFITKPLFQSSLYDLLASFCGKSREELSAKPVRHDFGGARILLVEDNLMNMEVAKHILKAAKLTVDSAWNGQEAVDIFTASEPGTYKAILMDVHMPVLNGYEATKMIRKLARSDAKSLPIIAMTADVFVQDIENAHNAGMNSHVAKPIDVETLYTVLSEYI